MVSDKAKEIIKQKWDDRFEADRNLDEWRAQWYADAAREPLPEGTQVEELTLGGVYCERVSVGEVAQDAVCFFPHGGGYVAGNCITHRKMAAHLSRVSGLAVILPDYRLAPEHPYPAGLDDTHAAYHGTLGLGYAADRVVVIGDSAGGGMSLALMLRLRDAGEALPKAAVLLSPWTDIEGILPSHERNAKVDPSIDTKGLREAGQSYFADADPKDPYISPIHADLSGLPPMLVHVGGLEVMADDSILLAQRVEAAGGTCELEEWDGLWHVWHNDVPDLPEAMEAWDKIGVFVRTQLGLDG